MPFAVSIKEIEPGCFTATTGIRLKSMRVQPKDVKMNNEEFVMNALDRQMDFIQSLEDMPDSFALDLRYLFDPQEQHVIKVYFLIRTKSATKEVATTAAAELEKYILELLLINNHLHEFVPVTDDTELSYLLQPFAFSHITEIVRREEFIELDTMKRNKSRPVGFNKNEMRETACQEHNKTPARIYYVFPYLLNHANMEKLCNSLFLQTNPCLASVCLSPRKINASDYVKFEERSQLCEKFSQLTISADPEVEKLDPFLKNLSQLLYKQCTKEMFQLQDAAFLMKLQIVSTHPVGQGVVDSAGTTITEHAGQSRLAFTNTVELENMFAGGYDCYEPQNGEEHRVALNNLANMEFDHWIPTIADSALHHWRYLFDITQSVAAFRLPIPVAAQFPGIDTILYHPQIAPSYLPTSGLLIGEHTALNKKRPVYYGHKDRARHTYVVGQTGTGKSTLFLNMILQDIQLGHGLGVLDPHGELIEEVLACIPPHREADVVYIDPKDYERPVGINMLDYKSVFEKDYCVNYLIEVFDILYDLNKTGGPMFEMYMRNALQLLLDQPENAKYTILDVPRLFQDRNFRKELLKKCENVYVRNFWQKEAEKAGGESSLENMAPYVTSKLTRFVYNDLLRAIIGQRESTINFREIMDSGKILLVDLRKGILGSTNSGFLGNIIVGKILAAALSRTDVKDKSTLRDFYLYVDEFQNLATPSFVSILSEARKYHLALTMTNQYIAQLDDHIIHGILGNVGTLISFRVGSNDAEILSKEFGENIAATDLLGLSHWHAYVKLLISGKVSAPFDMQTILPERQLNPGAAERISALSQERYGRARGEVEKEIQQYWGTQD